MTANSNYIIGVMSGTSLDGVDLAYVKIRHEPYYHFEILEATTIPYNKQWIASLQGGFQLFDEKLAALDAEYGRLLGKYINRFIDEFKIGKVDFIASHGHTIFHKPSENYTLQIGNGPEISRVTGIKTICDFRVQDVALGGQGAPLVPIGDELLFSEYDYCINLGGFSNISLNKNGKRIAYDICPVNIVLNHYARLLNLSYDMEGVNASTGAINEGLLAELNDIPYYTRHSPKTLGYEFIIETILPLIETFKVDIYDILRTFVEHIAIQIAQNIGSNSDQTVLITGGGAFNSFLMERIRNYTEATLIIPDKVLVNYKESLIFALLGYLKNRNEVNCLQSVTGAERDHSSGVIYNV
jgi:anhydro-N-acetylmuramic acid kinase